MMRSKFVMLCGLAVLLVATGVWAQQSKTTAPPPTAGDSKSPPNSYMQVTDTESFSTVRKKLGDAKQQVEKEHMDLLNDRYDLSDRPAKGVTMSRGKLVQEGVRVNLPSGVT